MKLHLHTSPFLRPVLDTPTVMRDVLKALVPVLLAGVWFFGLGALLVVATATLGAVLAEWAIGGRRSLRDGSAVLTGVLLGLTLPPVLPLWVALLGGVTSIALGKAVFGGLGQNPFNPALVGRAFLQAAFPTLLTTWSPPRGFFDLPSSLFALPMMRPEVDALTGATPLGLMKFEQQPTALLDLAIGDVGGSIGETSALVLVVVGLWLAWKRTFDWRIPVSILVTVALLGGLFWGLWPDRYPTPLFHVLSGGLLLGTIFMATDPVTSPTTARGAWAFGIGIGILVVTIRLWGGLPEAVMYAILLMNAVSPLLERWTQPIPFGRSA